MSKSKTTQNAGATPDLDPATAEHLRILTRQRRNARRALLKRRRRKSHQ